jgi:hypothetical protein
MEENRVRATIIPWDEAKGTNVDIPGAKPPIARFEPIEGLTHEEGEAFIELIRKMRHEGIQEHQP